jgi:hypothetical protein
MQQETAIINSVTVFPPFPLPFALENKKESSPKLQLLIFYY